jgi:hypothetical protein
VWDEDGRDRFDRRWDHVCPDGKDGVIDFDGMVKFYQNAFKGSTDDIDAFRVNIWDDIRKRRKNPENVVSYYEMFLFFSPEHF